MNLYSYCRQQAIRFKSIAAWIYLIGLTSVVAWLQYEFVRSFLSSEPHTKERQSSLTRFLSGTVCKDELIFLMDTLSTDDVRDWPIDKPHSVEEVRCDLRTGHISSTRSLPDIRHVVSDGETLWRLPADDRVQHPIVWRGRPVSVNGSSYRLLFCLMEFANGSWNETDEFLLTTVGYPATSPSPGSNSIPMLQHMRNESNMLCNLCVAVGTLSEAKEFYSRFSSGRKSLFDTGWWETRFDAKSFRLMYRPSDLESVSLGIWIENSSVYALQGEFGGPDAIFEFHSSSRDQASEVKRVRSPIRWGPRPCFGSSTVANYGGWIQPITSNTEDIYLVSVSQTDGRIHVMEWKDGRLKLVAQRRSPLVGKEFLAVEPIVRYVILIPALLLWLIVWGYERIQGGRQFTYGQQCVPLASVTRRGIAIGIDLSIPIAALAAAVALHPDGIGWLLEVKSQWSTNVVPCLSFASLPAGVSVKQIPAIIGKFYWELLSVPMLPWPFAFAILFLAAQTVWQGVTGRTFGNWLLGIKVVRTTLRPCGTARSLLREILLAVDSLMLLSWMPGIMFMIGSRKSQ